MMKVSARCLAVLLVASITHSSPTLLSGDLIEPQQEGTLIFESDSTIEITSTGSKVTTADAKAALKLHNDARKRIGAPPLKWSKKLSANAQQWADRLATENRFDHEEKIPFGENLANGSGRVNATVSTRLWLAEKTEHFDHGRLREAGHYTQAVWQHTTEVGIGIASRGGKIYVVARYNPPGNFSGQPIFPDGPVYP